MDAVARRHRKRIEHEVEQKLYTADTTVIPNTIDDDAVAALHRSGKQALNSRLFVSYLHGD